jgi:two-component system NtrC family sensor kinase
LVRGSKDKLKQVFLNIIANARDAMPGGGTLSITARPECGFVNIEISDTGAGIPEENLSRIFDAFFTTKEKVSGVGLGLSVCHGIVSQHDGKIAVRSKPGEGSTFTIALPHLGEDGA